MIKKFPLYMLLCMMVGLAACSDDEDDKVDNGYTTYNVSVQLLYPEDSEVQASAGVSVSLSSTSGTAYDATTDADGKAVFQVPAGIYAASASEVRAMDGYSHVLNGTASGITVNESWNPDNTVSIEMVESVSGQVVIKELYVGGCQKDDGSGLYQFDKYVILYNNSAQTATLENLCFGMVNPYNANTSTNDYVNGELVYEADGYIPAGCGIWYAQQDITIEPGKQIVVAMNGAINHTPTYSNSVDLSNADYCMYDMEDFSSTSYYPAPSENIPTGHYLLAYKYGQGTGWPLSNSSPAFFIFTTHDETPVEFASNPDYHYVAGNNKPTWCCAKVPNEWILDAVEVFNAEKEADCSKRLTSGIDSGYTLLTNKQGHTSYRNVDQAATEALPENDGKLVYGYAYGNDPSGIDAEASLANGARIIYQDTNNSTNDFHERSQASLRD